MAGWFAAFNLKAIEGALSSLSTPVLSAIKSGFDGLRSHPHLAILSTLVLATGGYFISRRYGKAKEVSNLVGINQSLAAIDVKLAGQRDKLDAHTTTLTTLARSLLALSEPLLSCKTSGINLERILAENQTAILRQFREQNGTLEGVNRSLGTLKTNVDVIVSDVRARAATL